ncbi:MAG: hypothetical protein JEY91_18010 [Spirochaetaceae bacterium]|nr:hypothetical protein [Spirochaetaceae bacterium]
MNKNLLLLLAISLLFILFSCSSKPESKMASSEPVIITSEDITISLAFISDDDLNKQFGKKGGNVFADYPGKITPKKSIVFQLNITTEKSDVELDLRNILLHVGETSGQSKYPSQLLQEWSTYLKNPEHEEKAHQLTRRNMFSNKIRVTPDKPASGLIVFLEKFPRHGDALIILGLETAPGEIMEIEIPLDLFLAIEE